MTVPDETSMTRTPTETVHRPGSVLALIERAEWHFKEAMRLWGEAGERSEDMTPEEALEILPVALRLRAEMKARPRA